MRPHELRVVAEKADLDDNLARLDAALANPAFTAERTKRQLQLLAEQRHYMSLYSQVLGVRIAEFEPEAPAAEPAPGET